MVAVLLMLLLLTDKSQFTDITCERTAALDGRSGGGARLAGGLSSPPCPDIRFSVAPDSCGPC